MNGAPGIFPTTLYEPSQIAHNGNTGEWNLEAERAYLTMMAPHFVEL